MHSFIQVSSLEAVVKPDIKAFNTKDSVCLQNCKVLDIKGGREIIAHLLERSNMKKSAHGRVSLGSDVGLFWYF